MVPSARSAVAAEPAVDIVPNAMDVSRTALVRRARTINRTLHQTYPDAHCELDFSSPLELLVATILSAQTTDKRVNLLTPILFARYPDAAAYAAADRAELEELLKPVGFFRAKSDTLLKLGAALVQRLRGRGARTGSTSSSPSPGSAARPPTSCSATRSVCPASPSTPTSAGWPDGSGGRRRWSPSRWRPRSARLFPRKDWTQLSHNVIWHGRRRCHARNPACGACPVARWCPSFGEGETDPKKAAKLVREPRG